MIISCTDVETTALIDYHKNYDDPGQPRIVSLGCVTFDETERELGCMHHIIKPEGFVIDNESVACKTNGITQELAMQVGVPIEWALGMLDFYMAMADVIVMFNSSYDSYLIKGENARLKRQHFLNDRKLRCMKEVMTPICRLPNDIPGYADFKWPSLLEAYFHLFGVDPVGNHNALQDARYTSHIAFELVARGLWDWKEDVRK